MATSMGLNTIYKNENKINVRRNTSVWRKIDLLLTITMI